MRLGALAVATSIVLFSGTPSFAARCVDLSTKAPVYLSGILHFQIFPGPPGYEDVRSGDSPEPTYILRLDQPMCFSGGDETVSESTSSADVQLVVVDDDPTTKFATLRRLINERVSVDASSLFGAHTGHHHAPILAVVQSVGPETDMTEGYGTPMTSVEGFYLALRAGDGKSAAEFVVPEKRKSGPLSAPALSAFFGNLKSSLNLLDVKALSGNRFRARYNYIAKDGTPCSGSSVVETVTIGGLNLIRAIKAETGC